MLARAGFVTRLATTSTGDDRLAHIYAESGSRGILYLRGALAVRFSNVMPDHPGVGVGYLARAASRYSVRAARSLYFGMRRRSRFTYPVPFASVSLRATPLSVVVSVAFTVRFSGAEAAAAATLTAATGFWSLSCSSGHAPPFFSHSRSDTLCSGWGDSVQMKPGV